MNEQDKRAFMAWYLDSGFAFFDSEKQQEIWEAALAYRDSQIEQDRKDAERYRWWKNTVVKCDPKMDGNHVYYTRVISIKGNSFDSAIDFAIISAERLNKTN